MVPSAGEGHIEDAAAGNRRPEDVRAYGKVQNPVVGHRPGAQGIGVGGNQRAAVNDRAAGVTVAGREGQGAGACFFQADRSRQHAADRIRRVVDGDRRGAAQGNGAARKRDRAGLGTEIKIAGGDGSRNGDGSGCQAVAGRVGPEIKDVAGGCRDTPRQRAAGGIPAPALGGIARRRHGPRACRRAKAGRGAVVVPIPRNRCGLHRAGRKDDRREQV